MGSRPGSVVSGREGSMRKPPCWRPELAAEIEMHQQLRFRLEHFGPQIAGLAQGVEVFLTQEPRMAGYARKALRLAGLALPYQHRPRSVQDYQGARRSAGRRRDLDSEAAYLTSFCLHWGDTLPVPAFTAVIWTVRHLFAIHRRRHGPVLDPWAEAFVQADRTALIQDLQHTMWGATRPEPRRVQAWRRYV